MSSPSPVLKLEQVCFAWKGQRGVRKPSSAGGEVLRGINLTMLAGERLLLCGSSGSGKSSLLAVISGLVAPTSGRVVLDGVDLATMSPGRRDGFRGRRLGMVMQSFALLEGFTAIENVMAGLMFTGVPPAEHGARASAALEALGMRQPESLVGELSIGQQQRVAIARAVVARPALVLADEPTASLDPGNAEAAIGLLRDACGAVGAALLVTSHDPGLRGRFERQCVLRDGGLVEEAAEVAGGGGAWR